MRNFMIVSQLLLVLSLISCSQASTDGKSNIPYGTFATDKELKGNEYFALREAACKSLTEFSSGQSVLQNAELTYKTGAQVELIKLQSTITVLEFKSGFLKTSIDSNTNGIQFKKTVTQICASPGQCTEKIEPPSTPMPVPSFENCAQAGEAKYTHKVYLGTYENSAAGATVSFPAVREVVWTEVPRKCSDGSEYTETSNGEHIYSLKHRKFTLHQCELTMVEVREVGSTTKGLRVDLNILELPLN
jgi:hypothetical protein